MSGKDNARDVKELLKGLRQLSAGDAEELLREGSSPSTFVKTQGVVRLGRRNGVTGPDGDEYSVGYSNEAYEADKLLGFRRDSGHLKLTKLKPIHRIAIALHLRGVKHQEIAVRVNQNYSWVCQVINDPLSQDLIQKVTVLQDEEFLRLGGLANDALRDSLQANQPINVRLRGAKIVKDEMHRSGSNGSDTAEDVMERMLNIINANNVQINIVGSDDSSGNGGSKSD